MHWIICIIITSISIVFQQVVKKLNLIHFGPLLVLLVEQCNRKLISLSCDDCVIIDIACSWAAVVPTATQTTSVPTWPWRPRAKSQCLVAHWQVVLAEFQFPLRRVTSIILMNVSKVKRNTSMTRCDSQLYCTSVSTLSLIMKYLSFLHITQCVYFDFNDNQNIRCWTVFWIRFEYINTWEQMSVSLQLTI